MNIILHSPFTRIKLNKISILIVFKKKNIAKEGEIENFFNKLFSPTNYHLLSKYFSQLPLDLSHLEVRVNTT